MSNSDPRLWYLDLDKLGWFIADDDPQYGDLFGVRYPSKEAATKALNEIVAGWLASEGEGLENE
jgi:hypothetical protein